MLGPLGISSDFRRRGKSVEHLEDVREAVELGFGFVCAAYGRRRLDLSLGGVSSLEVLLLDSQVSCRECEGSFAWSRPQSLPQPTGWDEDDFDLALRSLRAFL